MAFKHFGNIVMSIAKERWPQIPNFVQVVGLIQQTYQPSESIKNTIEVYLPKAIEIFCAKSFQDDRNNSQDGEQQGKEDFWKVWNIVPRQSI